MMLASRKHLSFAVKPTILRLCE